MRAGAQALSLLSAPLNVRVLRALDERARTLTDLRRAVGAPPETTLRGHLRNLTELGVLVRRRQNEFPGALDFELQPAGRDLVFVANLLQSWLDESPNGPVTLGGSAAKSVIGALVEGWVTNVLRALCAKRLSLTELSSLITNVSYPSLERRINAMRLAGQIEACPANGRSTPYAITTWLRRASAPLAAAMRWERMHISGQIAPVGGRDAETLFLLAVPLMSAAADTAGHCRLTMELAVAQRDETLSGVTVELTAGRVVSCTTRRAGVPRATVIGSAGAWLDAIVVGDFSTLEVGGDTAFARDVLDGFSRGLESRSPATAG